MGCHLTCPEFSQEPQRRAPGGVEGSGRRQPRRGEVTPGRHRRARTAPPGLNLQPRAARTATPHAPAPEARAEPRRNMPRRKKRSSARHGMARPAAPHRPARPPPCRGRGTTAGARGAGPAAGGTGGPPHTFNAAAAAEGKSGAIGGRLEGGGGCRPAPLLLLR